MALQKTLLKKRLRYRHPLPSKTSFCDRTIGSGELIFWTIPIKRCMDNLDFFQPNLRWSSGEFSFYCPVWRGMTLISVDCDITEWDCIHSRVIIQWQPITHTSFIEAFALLEVHTAARCVSEHLTGQPLS